MSFLRPVLRSLSRTRILQVPLRTCLTYDSGGSYEGDGKTSLVVLNRDVEDRLMIDAYSTHGFRLNSGLFVSGPAAFFPRTLLSWDVEGPWDVSIESLSLFWLVEPKPDILVIGVGNQGNTVPDDVRLFMNQKKISLEILETGAACHAFNFMNADHRNVAAALIPRQTMQLTSDGDLWDNVAVKGKLFSMYGSSINEVAEQRENRRVLESEEMFRQRFAGEYEPHNQVQQRDLKEMVEKGMISVEEAKKAFPKLQLGPRPLVPRQQQDKHPEKKSDEPPDQDKDGKK